MNNQNDFSSLTTGTEAGAERFTHWEYILDDLLEMACSLSAEDRRFLIQEMEIRNSISGSVDVHPSFSLEGRLVIIVGDAEIEECWLYYPNQKRIEKYPLRKKK